MAVVLRIAPMRVSCFRRGILEMKILREDLLKEMKGGGIMLAKRGLAVTRMTPGEDFTGTMRVESGESYNKRNSTERRKSRRRRKWKRRRLMKRVKPKKRKRGKHKRRRKSWSRKGISRKIRRKQSSSSQNNISSNERSRKPNVALLHNLLRARRERTLSANSAQFRLRAKGSKSERRRLLLYQRRVALLRHR